MLLLTISMLRLINVNCLLFIVNNFYAQLHNQLTPHIISGHQLYGLIKMIILLLLIRNIVLLGIQIESIIQNRNETHHVLSFCATQSIFYKTRLCMMTF